MNFNITQASVIDKLKHIELNNRVLWHERIQHGLIAVCPEAVDRNSCGRTVNIPVILIRIKNRRIEFAVAVVIARCGNIAFVINLPLNSRRGLK
jgi:hypothetical protein